MKTRIAVFVKTPDVSDLKTRLAQTSSRQIADDFYRLSLRSIDEWLSLQTQSDEVEAYWAVAEDPCLVAGLWANHPVISQGGGGLGDRLDRVFSQLNERGQNLVVLIGADCPQLTSALLMQTRRAISRGADMVIGPSRDGGFYWFASCVSIWPTTWTSVTYSTHSTLNDLLATPQIRKLSVHYLPTLSDVDHYEDLCRVAEDLRQSKMELCESQRILLNWIESLFVNHRMESDSKGASR